MRGDRVKGYLKINDENRIVGFSLQKDSNFPIEYTFESEEEFKKFYKNPYAFLVNGKIVFDETNKIEDEIQELRMEREQLFKIFLDRSSFWYEELTEEQKEELKNWRKQWKDMPELVRKGKWEKPKIPEWLK